MKKKSPTPSLIDNEIAVKPNSLEGGAVHLDGASLNSTQSLVKRNATGKKGNQKKKFIEEDAQSKSLDEIALASKAMFAMNEGGGVASDVNQGPDLLLAMNESTPSSSTEQESDTCKSENASGDKEQDGCAALLPVGGVTEGGIAAGALAAGEGGISAGAIAAGVLLLAGGVAAGASGGGGGGGSSGGGSTGSGSTGSSGSTGGSDSTGGGSSGGGGAADMLAPTVTITDNTAGTASGPVTFTFTFDEAVSGFDASKVSVTGGTKGTFTAVSSTVYTLVVSPTSGVNSGTLTLVTSTSGVTNSAGQQAVAPADYTQAYDTQGPGYGTGGTDHTLSVVVPDAAGGGINATEAADGVGVDVTLPSDAAVGDVITVNIDGGAAVTHTVTAADITAGTVTVTLPAAAITAAGEGAGVIRTAYADASGNPAKDSPVNTNVTIDTQGPGYGTGGTDHTLSVVVPDAAGGGINATEAADGVGVDVTLPSDAAVGDVITVNIDGGAAVTHTVTAADITAGTVTVTLPAAAITAAGEGAGVIRTAYADASGNPAKDSPVNTNVTIDTQGPGYGTGGTDHTLSVVVPDAAGGGINATEAADGVGVDVTLPSDAAVGDVITVNIDGGAAVTHTVTAADITAGTVTVTLPAAAITAAGEGAGVIRTAYADASGNPAKDSPVNTNVTIDTQGPGYGTGGTDHTLSVVVPDAAGGGINATEAADGVGVDVTLPSDAAVGDVITVNIDGGAAVTHTVTAADITAGTVTVTLPAAAITAAGEGAGVIRTAYADASGNPAKDSPVNTNVTIDTQGPGYGTGGTDHTLSVVVPDAAGGGINATEAADGVGVDVTLPSDAAVGDVITVNIDGGAAVTHTVTAADITAGTVTVTLPAAAITAAGEGAGVIRTAYADASGNPAKDSPVNTNVTIDTLGPGYGTGGTDHTLSVVVPDAAGGGINATEAADGVGVDVTLPSDAAVGDVITVNIDGGAAVTHTVTAADITAGTVTVTLPAAAITAAGEGAGVIRTAYADASGNPAKDSPVNTNVTIDTQGPGYGTGGTDHTLSVVVPDAAGGGINATEAADGVGVDVTLPSDAAVGDVITVNIDGGAAVTHTVTAADITAGTVTVTLPAAAITAAGEGAGVIRTAYADASGNPAKDSPVNTNVTIDTLAPTATVGDNTSGTTPGPFTFSFIFDEAVSGFNINNVNVTGGTKGEFTAVNDFEYRLVVNPDSGINNGTITLTENMAGVTDAAGNVAATPSPYTQTYDTLAPTVTITDNTAGTASGPVTFTFTFNEAVSGFDENDVTVSAGTKGAFTAVSPTEYTLVVTPPSSTGTMVIGVTAGSFWDLAGNLNTVAPTPDSQPYNSSEIDLGAGNGKLILPVDVDGSRFYLWSKDGDNAFSAGDIVTHIYLNSIFKYDINGNVNPDGETSTVTYRYGTINGVHLALPVVGYSLASGFSNTAVNSTPPNQDNPTYDGYAAIWDAFTTGTGASGTPPGWSGSGLGGIFWAADKPGSSAVHSAVNMANGSVTAYADSGQSFVALQVVL